jgi:hypothetical protein
MSINQSSKQAVFPKCEGDPLLYYQKQSYTTREIPEQVDQRVHQRHCILTKPCYNHLTYEIHQF